MLKHRKKFSGGGWMYTPTSLDRYNRNLGLVLGIGTLVKSTTKLINEVKKGGQGLGGNNDWSLIALTYKEAFGKNTANIDNVSTEDIPEAEVTELAFGGPLNTYDWGGWVEGIGGAVGDVANIYTQSALIDNNALDTAKLNAQAKNSSINPAANSLDSLMAEWAGNRNLKTDYRKKDFLGMNNAERLISGGILSVYAGHNALMKTKNMYAGIGTAAAGLIGTGIGAISANRKARREKNRANAVGKNLNNVGNLNLATRAGTLDNANDMINLRSYKAYGGPIELLLLNDYNNSILNSYNALAFNYQNPYFTPLLKFEYGGLLGTHGNMFDNGVMYINAGGTHEANPNEGVLIGVDSEGTPNVVEEDELVWNDFVFSNRLPTPLEFLDKYKLGGELTFAETAEKLARESEERPNDPISKDTENAIFSELALTLELYKYLQLLNKFAYGGNINRFDDGGWEYIGKKKALKGNSKTTYKAYNFEKFKEEFGIPKWVTVDIYNKAMLDFGKSFEEMNADELHKILQGYISNLPDDYDINSLGQTIDVFKAKNGYADRSAYTNTSKNWSIALLIAPKGGWENSIYNPTRNNEVEQSVVETPPVKENPSLEEQEDLTKYVYNGPEGVFTRSGQESTTPPNNIDSLLSNLKYAPTIGSLGMVISDMLGLTNKVNYTEADGYMLSLGQLKPIGVDKFGQYLIFNPTDNIWALNNLKAALGLATENTLGKANGNRALAMALAAYLNQVNLSQLGLTLLSLNNKNNTERERVININNNLDLANAQLALSADLTNFGLNNLRMNAILLAAIARRKAQIEAETAKALNFSNLFNNLGALGLNEWNMNSMNNTGSDYLFGRNGMYFNNSAEGGKIRRTKKKRK